MTFYAGLKRFFWRLLGKPFRVKYQDGQWTHRVPFSEADGLASIFKGTVYTEYEYQAQTKSEGRPT